MPAVLASLRTIKQVISTPGRTHLKYSQWQTRLISDEKINISDLIYFPSLEAIALLCLLLGGE